MSLVGLVMREVLFAATFFHLRQLFYLQLKYACAYLFQIELEIIWWPILPYPNSQLANQKTTLLSWYPTILSHWFDIPRARYHGHFQVKQCKVMLPYVLFLLNVHPNERLNCRSEYLKLPCDIYLAYEFVSSWDTVIFACFQMSVTVLQRKDSPVFCNHGLSLCSLYNTQSKLFFIHYVLPRLSPFFASYYSSCGPLGITPGRFYYRNAKFWAEFGCGKHLIVPF